MPATPAKMTDEQIQQALKDVPEWAELSGAIQRTFRFDGFVAAMRFVNGVAEMAERQQHHPDILVRYNKVTLTVNTHDAGGITERDFALARAVDGMFGAGGGKAG